MFLKIVANPKYVCKTVRHGYLNKCTPLQTVGNFREHKREQMKSKWNPHVALSHLYDCGQVKVEVSPCSELCLDCRLACGIRWRYVAHIWILFSTESSYPRRLLLRQPCLWCLTSPFILWLRRRTICGASTLLNYNVHVNATADSYKQYTTAIGALDVSVTADTSDTAAIGAKRDEAVSEHRDI
jgi:hypothetical protein